ncbi:MAG: hypothetical protein WB660_15910, partial [Candidatus Sulfotelmatobacter sp.]
GNRGRPTPWALPAALRRSILELAQYHGFNDSHLCQKLHSEEHLSVSRETVSGIAQNFGRELPPISFSSEWVFTVPT